MESRKSVNLQENLDGLPAERRYEADAGAAELIAEKMSLRDLRKAMGKSQEAVAAKLGTTQQNISRTEQRPDLMLSTLNSYLKTLSGRLRLVAEFEGRAPVTLLGIAALEETGQPAERRVFRSERKK